MGLFDGIKGMKEVNKIRNGGKGNLSIAQITNLIINLPDAKNKLSNDEYNQVYSLFNDLQKCNTKMEMGKEEYYNTAVDIIRKFDKIAPYEKYSGGNELEFSFLMDKIHNNDKENANKVKKIIDDTILPEELEYANVVADSSNGIVSREDSKEFIKVIHIYSVSGKEDSINKFKEMAQMLIDNNKIKAISQISYLLGVMNANKIISQSEMDILSKEYQDKIMKLLMNNS